MHCIISYLVHIIIHRRYSAMNIDITNIKWIEVHGINC